MAFKDRMFFMVGNIVPEAYSTLTYHNLEPSADIRQQEVIKNFNSGSTRVVTYPLIASSFVVSTEAVNSILSTAKLKIVQKTTKGPQEYTFMLRKNCVETIKFPDSNIIIKCGIAKLYEPSPVSTSKETDEMYAKNAQIVGQLVGFKINQISHFSEEPQK